MSLYGPNGASNCPVSEAGEEGYNKALSVAREQEAKMCELSSKRIPPLRKLTQRIEADRYGAAPAAARSTISSMNYCRPAHIPRRSLRHFYR